MTIPQYKRVRIDWDQLFSCISAQGYTFSSLAKIIGMSTTVFYQAKADGKMNPAVVVEISKYVDIDVPSIITDKTVEKPCNARSTSGRIGTDWLYLERSANEKGYSLEQLSVLLGKAPGYLHQCKREGGISEDILQQLGKILEIDYHNLIKVTSYDRWNLRNEIVNMIYDFEWDDPIKRK